MYITGAGFLFDLKSVLMQQHKPARRLSCFTVNAAHLGVRQYGAGTMQGVTPPLPHCSSDRPSGMVSKYSTIFSMHAADYIFPTPPSISKKYFPSLLTFNLFGLSLHVFGLVEFVHVYVALFPPQ